MQKTGLLINGGLIAAIFLWLGIAPAFSQEASFPPVPIENSEIRTLSSSELDREFRIFIAKPLGPPPNQSRTYPVIYVLDPEIAFALVRQITISLQFGFEMPPALIVGIGNEVGPRAVSQFRTRDYTPTFDPAYAKFAAKWEGGSGQEDSNGGAAAFLTFIRDELKPFIEQNYPADPGDATIMGASFGGLFGAYALLAEPDTFQRYVLSSPSLWWDNSVMFDLEETYAADHEDLDARVFIAAGERERKEFDDALIARVPPRFRESITDFQELLGDGAQMVEVVEPFADTLKARGYPGLSLDVEIFPGETHSSTPPFAFTRGLRVVFDTY